MCVGLRVVAWVRIEASSSTRGLGIDGPEFEIGVFRSIVVGFSLWNTRLRLRLGNGGMYSGMTRGWRVGRCVRGLRIGVGLGVGENVAYQSAFN